MNNRNLLTSFILCFFVFFGAFLAAEERVGLSLSGHLGKERIKKTIEKIGSFDSEVQTLALVVNSTSGDLNAVLELAKRVYEWKSVRGRQVVVYLDGQAIGPAAIIPFLADQLYASVFVSWGDIPLGDDTLPTHLLRNRVLSLIPDNHPHSETLSAMARAMSDPDVSLNRLGLSVEKEEVLVLNHKQLKRLGLVKEVLSLNAFKKRFFAKTEEKEPASSVSAVKEEVDASLDERLKKWINYDPEGENTVGYIVVEGRRTGISQSTWIYVKTALDHYKESKPAFVILRLNTPGGEVFASQKISDGLKELDTQYGIPVVAFIDNWAISAGAMLAYSCRFISVVKDASMGAAEPVISGGEGGAQPVSEKVNSAIRTDFANRAGFFGRDPLLAEAMVDKDAILVLRHGKIMKLDSEDQIRTSGPNPDELISAEGKLLTLSAKEMMKFGVADLLLPPQKIVPITSQERSEGKWPADKMLLFQYPFFKNIPNAVIDEFQMDWKTRFFTWLTHPIVASLLFMGLLIGFYMEMSAPGFGVPGSIAVLCLCLVLLSSFALEAVHWLELILLFGGVALVAIDLFLIPTFGILGFFGLIAFIVGLFGILLPGIGEVSYEFDTQTFNAAGEFVLRRFAWLCGSLVTAAVVIGLLGRYVLPRLAPFSRFVLMGNEQDATSGFVAGEKREDLPPVGSTGEVVGLLRPAGKVQIEGRFYHAETQGEYLGDGEEVVVVDIDESVLVVAPRENA